MNLKRRLEVTVKFSVLSVIVIAIHHLLSLLGTGQEELPTYGVNFVIPEIFKLKLSDGISRNWDVLAGIIWPIYIVLLTTGKKVSPDDRSDFFSLMGIGVLIGGISMFYLDASAISSFAGLSAISTGVFSALFDLEISKKVKAFSIGIPILVVFKFGIVPALSMCIIISSAFMTGIVIGSLIGIILSPETYYIIGDFFLARKPPEEDETPAD